MTPPHPGLPDDPQTERSRWELRTIFVIVVVIIIGSLAWRAIGHHHAKREISTRPPGSPGTLPAAPGGLSGRTAP